jgi:PAS domain S-box-containing protein
VTENERLRIQAEQKLKHSELRLRQAQAIAHFGNWELDFSNGVATWSEEACRIYGLNAEDNKQTYESWLSFLHPDDRDMVINIADEARKTLRATDILHRIVCRAGETKYIRSITHFEFNPEGKPIGLYGVAHDVTDIKQTEQALIQSKNNLRVIVDLIPQAIYAMNKSGDFVFVNKSFADLYGMEIKDLVYKNIEAVLPANNQHANFMDEARQVIESGKSKIIPEAKFTDYLGKLHIFYSIKVPYSLPGSGERVMLGIALDITEQKEAEYERSRMVEDIVQRNKDHEQFSYIVSHNLRAPLANIIGLANLLEFDLKPGNHERIMTELFNSVKKLDTVIRDLNQVLQVKHQTSESKEWLSFSTLVNDVARSIENLVKKENAEIFTDFGDADKILAVKSYMYSIFMNLITNSIRYRRPAVQPVIRISSHREGDKTVIVFKDNGLGIDLTRKGVQVFGMYKRFHQHIEGKGMGLYLVKTQVETMGGSIAVSSEVNKGTEFRITF